AEGQYALTIDAGDIAKEYTVPGQYVQIKVTSSAKPNFFAIASPPDARYSSTTTFVRSHLIEDAALLLLCLLP
ncbi:unnamed protein product, partial [Ectocarpus sp. 13 AM-2016]